MTILVSGLCALTSLACAVLLWRGYRRHPVRLLFWSGLFFAFMALGNLILIADVQVLPTIDLSLLRSAPHLAGVLCLLYGLVWEGK